MYTRSYRKNGESSGTRLPPDYGGTALVINQNEQRYEAPKQEEAPEMPSESTVICRPAIQRQPRRQSISAKTDENTSAKRYLPEKEPVIDNIDLSEPSPPLGNRNGVGSSIPSQALPTQDKEHKSPLVSFLDPEQLKSDDLLLLGLLFLIFKEGNLENSKEALLILAVLYLSGL